MFDYLKELYKKEQINRKKNPSVYDLDLRSFFTEQYLPKKTEDLINFNIAYAIKVLSSCPQPSPGRPIYLISAKEIFISKCTWTSFMILGMTLPEHQFDEKSLYHSFDISSELGWFSKFSSNSLYENQFKQYLTKDRVEFYLTTISNQIAQKRQHESDIEMRESQKKIIQEQIAADKKKQDDIAAEARKLEKIKLTNSISLQEEVIKFDCKCSKIKELLSKGADINYKSENNGYTPLMNAIDAQNDRIAEYLLNQSANPLLKNKADEKASDLASSDSPIYQKLKGYELLTTTLSGNLAGVKLAINTNAYINFKGIGGRTALLIAVENNFVDIVSFLLSQDADLTITRNDGRGPFELVDNEDILELLEDARSFVESQTPQFG